MRLPLGVALLAGVLLSVVGCATLNTSDMSPACRDQYNACLNSCQPPTGATRRVPEGTTDSQTARLPGDVDTASCVDECNRRGKSCSQ